MKSRYYILKGKKIVPVELLVWAKWLEENRKEKLIKQETLPNGKWVSTVFLGLNHSFSEKGMPLIFETMVFPKKGKWGELDMVRYSTYEGAEEGHKEMVKKWRKKI